MNSSSTSVVAMADQLFSQANQTLAEAFLSDPTCLHFFPEDTKRGSGLEHLFKVALRHGRDGGAVDLLQDGAGGVVGVAVWLQSERARMTLLDMWRAGVPRVSFAIGLGATRRILRFMNWIESQRETLLPSAHWYLLNLAVRPGQQGRGLGSALLRHGLDRARNDRLPCFLETANTRNVPLYERHGFRKVYEGLPPAGGPLMQGFST
jgi:ribosomal protein S18 acetylase RimI-like enzyme